jgi:hypothetical protein
LALELTFRVGGMPQQAPQLGAYVFARSPRSKRIRFAAGAQAAGSVALRQGEFVKDNAIAAAKKSHRGGQKKAPARKPGLLRQTVRGVGETRGTAWHDVNAALLNWFRKNLAT